MVSYIFVPVTCLHQLYVGALPHFWQSRSEMDQSFTLSTEILYLYVMAVRRSSYMLVCLHLALGIRVHDTWYHSLLFL